MHGAVRGGTKTSENMFRILFFLMAGIGAGYLLRRTRLVKFTGQATRIAVVALLFVFGASIGANGELIGSLSRFGAQAAIFALLGVAGSLFAVGMARRLFFNGKGGAR